MGPREGDRSWSPRFTQGPCPAANLNKLFPVWLEMLEEEDSNRSRDGMPAVAAAAAAASGTVASGEAARGEGVSLARSPSKPVVSFWLDSWKPFRDPVLKLANLESPRDLKQVIVAVACDARYGASVNPSSKYPRSRNLDLL